MPNTNITKIAAFVILLTASSIISTGCSLLPAGRVAADEDRTSSHYEKAVVTGKLESDDLREASGIAASRCQSGVFWTHNDSGDDAFLFAIDIKGKNLGVWKVPNAVNRDWEDIAAVKNGDKCQIIIGDIGNNDLDRESLTIYRVDEPAVTPDSASSSEKAALTTLPAGISTFRYPDERHNAEALLAAPETGEIYIITKSKKDPAQVYKFKPSFEGDSLKATKVGEVVVPAIPNGVITGGDIAADGKRLVLCDYFAGYELALPAAAKDFDDIWKQKPTRIDLGKREIGEAIAYSPDGSFLVAISENVHTPVIKVQRKN